jgi:hypothetical protein
MGHSACFGGNDADSCERLTRASTRLQLSRAWTGIIMKDSQVDLAFAPFWP